MTPTNLFRWQDYGNDIHIGAWRTDTHTIKFHYTGSDKEYKKQWYEVNRQKVLEKARIKREQKWIEEGKTPPRRSSVYSRKKMQRNNLK